jgi:hypothetical protein
LSNTCRLALDVTGQQMDETFLRGSERFSELLARGDVAHHDLTIASTPLDAARLPPVAHARP